VFREHLHGLYLFGSAVSGGLRPSSDLDLLAIVAAPTAAQYRKLSRRPLDVSSWCPTTRTGHPIELTVVALSDLVPWRYPPRRQFQFGEWLRSEFERGEISPPSDDPDIAIMLASARANSIEL
jgi:streptomycin 3"-adenylyltransferase